ncbi:MAG: FAD-binding protein [Phycisphaera sp.]|nr:FAD-binding protein [Phycisphaera sp.]
MTDRPHIQGIACAQVIRTSDAAGFASAIADTANSGGKVVDYGRYHRGLGHAPPPDHVVIDAPAGVIDHYVPDMTVRVAAGTRLAELHAELAAAGQFLPLDGPGEMRVGEAVAHNAFGPLRIAHGSVRDMLLGLRYVDATGVEITVGGRTVKNVAGYDVTRMMVGNLNTLGLLSEVTIRTAATPRRVTQVHLPGVDTTAFDRQMTPLLTSDAAPWHMMLQTSTDNEGHAHTIAHLAYAGDDTECDARYAALTKWLSDADIKHGDIDRRDTDLDDDINARGDRVHWRTNTPAVVKVIAPPAVTGHLTRQLLKIDPCPRMIDALPSVGVLHVGGDWDVQQARAADKHLLDLLQPHGGLRVWLTRPDDTPDLAPAAPPQPDWAMLKKLKHAMDPNDVFNPGRLP